VVPDIYNVFTALHIQDSTFNWTYLWCYRRYIDNSMCVILPPWFQYSAQPSVYALWILVPDIYIVNTVPHIQATIFNWTYLGRYWRYVENSMRLILQTLCQVQRTSSRLRYLNGGPSHILCNYSSTYSGFNIQRNVSALLLEIFRLYNVHYTENILPNTAHILQFTLCELWFRANTRYLQLRIFRHQYSGEDFSSALGVVSANEGALYCKFDAIYSAHPPVCAMWTVVPDIYKAFTASDIQDSIYNSTYLRCYWRYLDNSMRVILQTLRQIQRTSPSLRCVNCGLDYIQNIYCSTYSGFNIQL
jgi:hypothetical protein